MTLTSNIVMLGSAPDFQMKLGREDLFHKFSLRLEGAGSMQMLEAISDRSLIQAVRIVQQKLVPFDCDVKPNIHWMQGIHLQSSIGSMRGAIHMVYQFHAALDQVQRSTLSAAVNEFFNVFLANTK